MSFYYFEVGGGGDYDVTLLGLLAIYQKIFCSFLHPTSPTTNIQCHLKHLNQFLKHFQNWVSWDWLLHCAECQQGFQALASSNCQPS